MVGTEHDRLYACIARPRGFVRVDGLLRARACVLHGRVRAFLLRIVSFERVFVAVTCAREQKEKHPFHRPCLSIHATPNACSSAASKRCAVAFPTVPSFARPNSSAIVPKKSSSNTSL